MHFDPEGNLLQTLDTLTPYPGFTNGMAFDRLGNLYVTVTNFYNVNQVNKVTKFDAQGLLLGTFGSGFVHPESIVFDSAGNAYVSGAGSNQLHKFDPQGNLLAQYTLATELRGVDWIDLRSDQCQVFYTSEGFHVKVFDTCANAQLPDLSILPAPPPLSNAYALRLLPTGEMLVATSYEIYRLDSSGQVIQVYDVPDQDFWFGLNLDPDGTSFWATSETGDPAKVYKFDIETGQLLLTWPVTLPQPGGGVGGVLISPYAVIIEPLTTTRWKPQRDTTTPIDVVFTGPADVSGATLEIADPNDVLIQNPTLAFQALGGNQYKVTWSGPWTPNLPRGNYKVKVIATVTNGTIESNPNDPNGLISFVEVIKVELCTPIDDNNCDALDQNPGVDSIGDQDPPQWRYGEGRRIFADPTQNAVKVRVTVDPKVPEAVPVHFLSFDVDDPAPWLPDADGDIGPTVADNLASPAQGQLSNPGSPEQVLPNTDIARKMFQVSGQYQNSSDAYRPGDNYRVVASTALAWITGVKSLQPNLRGELDVDADGQPDAGHPNVSDMLTVWRMLHIETESMAPLPQGPTHSQRNFIQGVSPGFGIRDVLASENKAVRLVLLPEGTLTLQDASPVPGRFENGTICVGSAAAPVAPYGCTGPILVTQLDGNQLLQSGFEAVKKAAGILLPFQLRDASGGNLLPGNVVALSSTSTPPQVTLNVSVGQVNYVNGSLTVGGITWTVSGASQRTVSLQDMDSLLPFVAVDDDMTADPFEVAIPNHMQGNTDDANVNLLAQAYVRPVWDPPNGSTPPSFKRNIPRGEPTKNQLEAGRNTTSSPGFWAAYLQGSFQLEEDGDTDPFLEDSQLGIASKLLSGGTFVRSYGALIAYETLRDVGIGNCEEKTVIHETGHQLSLLDDEGAIMNEGCYEFPWYFAAEGLAGIRSLLQP